MIRPQLKVSQFMVRTDRQALRRILNLKEPAGRLARLRFKLMEFDVEIVYRPGECHNAADAMSGMR